MTASLPTGRLLETKTAEPDDSGAVPNNALPDENETVPVGLTELDDEVTLAVSVTGVLNGGLADDTDNAVEVAIKAGGVLTPEPPPQPRIDDRRPMMSIVNVR